MKWLRPRTGGEPGPGTACTQTPALEGTQDILPPLVSPPLYPTASAFCCCKQAFPTPQFIPPRPKEVARLRLCPGGVLLKE